MHPALVAGSRKNARPKAPKAKTPDTTQHQSFTSPGLWRVDERKDQIDAIMREHDFGFFQRSADLVDQLLTDDRIYGVLSTRIDSIASAPITFTRPGKKEAKEKQVVDVLAGQAADVDVEASGLWDEIVPQESAHQLFLWGLMIGVGVGELVWMSTDAGWVPRVVPWHPRALRWDWQLRRFILHTQEGKQIVLPRPDEEPRCDGKWIVWCPYGVQEGWRRALLRPLAMKYISRQWVERDWDRYCEKHGLAIIEGKVPAESHGADKDQFFSGLANLGSEGIVIAAQRPDGANYGIELKEATARTFEAFEKRKAGIDTDVAVAVVGQNLTTEVKEGSLAAAKTHNLVRMDKKRFDARIGPVFRQQVLTWFTEFNFGDPELAPYPKYTVEPPQDEKEEAEKLKAIGDAAIALSSAAPRVDVEAILENHGVPLISEEELEARQAVEQDEAGDPDDGGDGGDGEEPEAEDDEVQDEASKEALRADVGSRVISRYQFQGLDIAVENPAGTIRLWGEGGVRGSTKMQWDYGFIEGALSGDGEELDCYIGPLESARDVFVVHQLKRPDYRAFDEDKVMIGFASVEDARAAYMAHRDDGDRAIQGISVIPLERFKAKLRRRSPGATTKIRANASTVTALMKLAARAQLRAAPRTVAGAKRAASYEDRLRRNGQALAARALAVDLAAVKDEIDKATSFQDLKRRIVVRFRAMKPARLAEVLRKTDIMARLSGRVQAVREV